MEDEKDAFFSVEKKEKKRDRQILLGSRKEKKEWNHNVEEWRKEKKRVLGGGRYFFLNVQGNEPMKYNVAVKSKKKRKD